MAEPALLSEMGKDRNSYVKLLSQIVIHKWRTGSAAVSRIPAVGAQEYIDLYEKMLQRPIINRDRKIFQFMGDSPDTGKNANRAHKMGKRNSGPNNREIMVGMKFLPNG